MCIAHVLKTIATTLHVLVTCLTFFTVYAVYCPLTLHSSQNKCFCYCVVRGQGHILQVFHAIRSVHLYNLSFAVLPHLYCHLKSLIMFSFV